MVQKGARVDWSISEAASTGRKKTYVISFDTIPEESGPLKTFTDRYSLTFNEAGIYTYRCSIQTRMVAKIEVVGDHTDVKACSQLRSTDIKQLIASKPPFEYKQQHSPAKPSDTDLNQRLIQILDEEEDLTKGCNADSKIIKSRYFKEIFESKRMPIQEISSDDQSEHKVDENTSSHDEEESFMSQQRHLTKTSPALLAKQTKNNDKEYFKMPERQSVNLCSEITSTDNDSLEGESTWRIDQSPAVDLNDGPYS